MTRKPRARNPTPLDRFMPLDYEVLQYVADHGRIDMIFETSNMAYNSKQRYWRLKESLQALAKGDPLQKASQYFVFKVSRVNNVLTIVDRLRSSEAQTARDALHKAPQVSADPEEIRGLDMSIFDGEDNGNEASKG